MTLVILAELSIDMRGVTFEIRVISGLVILSRNEDIAKKSLPKRIPVGLEMPWVEIRSDKSDVFRDRST